mgnify:CR=1 FL=1
MVVILAVALSILSPKRNALNSISAAVGDNRVQKYQTSLQAGKLGISAVE